MVIIDIHGLLMWKTPMGSCGTPREKASPRNSLIAAISLVPKFRPGNPFRKLQLPFLSS